MSEWFITPRRYGQEATHGSHSEGNIIFQDKNYHFPGQSIQDLKVINRDTCAKAYHIYSMDDRFLLFFMVEPFSSLLAV